MYSRGGGSGGSTCCSLGDALGRGGVLSMQQQQQEQFESSWSHATLSSFGFDVVGGSQNKSWDADCVASKIQRLISILDGKGRTAEKGDELARCFDAVFDLSLVAVSRRIGGGSNDDNNNAGGGGRSNDDGKRRQRKLSYRDLYEEFADCFERGHTAELVDITPYKGRNAHSMDYTVRVSKGSGVEITFNITAIVVNGKTTRLWRTESSIRDHSQDENTQRGRQIIKGPTETRDPADATSSNSGVLGPMQNRRASSPAGTPLLSAGLATVSLPKQVRGQLLANPGTGMTPSGETIKLLLEHPTRGSLARSSNLSILDARTLQPYAGGAYVKKENKRLIKNSYCLVDKEDNVVAVSIQTRYNTSRCRRTAYFIYGTRPLVANDVPVLTYGGHVHRRGDVRLYPWFRVQDVIERKNRSHQSIAAWNGTRFQRMWRAYSQADGSYAGSRLINNGNVVVEVTDDAAKIGHLMFAGCQNIAAAGARSSTATCSATTRNDKNYYEATVAPGVDPALFICLAFTLSDMVASATTSKKGWPSISCDGPVLGLSSSSSSEHVHRSRDWSAHCRRTRRRASAF